VASRLHKIKKVYTCNDDASDLLFIGRAKMTLINGKYLEGDFIGRAVYENLNSSDIKMKHFQVWGVSVTFFHLDYEAILIQKIIRIQDR
jgi:hypothetical protein